MKDISVGFAAFVLGALVLAGLGYASYASYAYYAPRYRAVDNAVFHNSQQYTDGMVQQLEQYQEQYAGGNQAQKDAIRSIVREQYAVFPEDRLNPDLRNFLESMKGL